ncbi:hypothetical protein BDR05DRAFT_966103, partial [Suillus weaverae]
MYFFAPELTQLDNHSTHPSPLPPNSILPHRSPYSWGIQMFSATVQPLQSRDTPPAPTTLSMPLFSSPSRLPY